MQAFGSLVPSEVAAVERLRAAGALGAVHISFPRRVVFIEAFADFEEAARETVLSLPMGPFFDLDVFETGPAGVPGGPIVP